MSLIYLLAYSPKPSAFSFSEAQWNHPAYNKSTFNSGEIIMLNIPTGRRESIMNMRMRYLQFRLNNTSKGRVPLRSYFNIASIISRLECYHAVILLDSVNDYALLVNLLMNICWSTVFFVTACILLEGHSTTSRVGTSLAAGTSYVLCIPLLSGLSACAKKKYLPTGDLTAGDSLRHA